MKNNIILCMCVFLLLNSCRADHDTETAITKHINKTKNTYIDEIKNLIETPKATIGKNKISPIKPEDQKNTYSQVNREVFTIDKRAFEFINTFLTENEIDEFTIIFHKPKLKSAANVLNTIAILELDVEKTIKHLFSKKDALDKAKISDLKKIKNSLKQLFSIRKFFAKIIKQSLLDYQKNRKSIKTDNSKLNSYLDTLSNQLNEKNKEVKNLRTTIVSTPIPNIME
ncbi:CRASP family complement regulator-acquiring lipoprotein (plasmid) [Borreliella spielmanii]|uniref:Borrelia burgdorferi virulent strain associated lipoprotein n=1 Tax=Borreliella spielmanii A14S TaxID=498742 RepID=C0RC96_9SPIR|nr:CRASP family complement regulator-acquiring lipoprotein [Borreliella spielmanii]ACN53393.1 borrelia burgdorferi virulent strain associated lipoprotein [Borreliella spielmanii A14S]